MVSSGHQKQEEPRMPSELNFKPAHELARLIRSKELSPVELLQACLDRGFHRPKRG